MKVRRIIILTALFCCFLAAQVTADTSICASYTGNASWTMSGSPYVITCSTSVQNTGVLTIDPGVTVKFNTGTRLDIYGRLTAIGNSGSPIIFTSSAPAPAPGNWQSIYFRSGTMPSSSRISFARIDYAGATDGGAVVISGSSPPMDNLTISNSSSAGIKISGSAALPTLSDSNLTGNATYGINLLSGGINFANTAITNNGDYAISAGPGTSVQGLTGLTVTGNGGGDKNCIGYRGGAVGNGETWRAGLDWVVLANTSVNSNFTLNISPGVTVKFANNVQMDISGKLNATGTLSSPITLTAASASPAPGGWRSLYFWYYPDNLTGPSQLAYVSINYGGAVDGAAIVLTSMSPQLDHVTITNSSSYGMKIKGNSNPLIGSCSFSGNILGAMTNTGSSVVSAKFSYWGSPTGPSGSGPGTGQSVSSNILYEPWITTIPSNPQYFNSSSLLNRVFNPSISTVSTIGFATSAAGDWKVTISNTSNTALRTFLGNGLSGSAVWDGKDEAGISQGNGTYIYQVESVTAANEIAAPLRATLVIDSNKQLTMSSLVLTYPYFSPNSDSIQDTTRVTTASSFDDTIWTLDILDPGNTIIRSSTSQGNGFSFTWDGKDSTGAVVPDAAYTLRLSIIDGEASAISSITAIVDDTSPSADIPSPTEGQTVSNVYQNANASVPVIVSAADANFASWVIDYSPTGGSWSQLSNGSSPVSNSTVWTWNSLNNLNGTYTFRLRANDRAGNQVTILRNVINGNFSVSQNVLQLSAATAQTVSYTSIVPFSLTETLFIKNSEGQVVRTLVNTSRNSANYVDVWNGKGDSNNLLPDGPYSYYATVADGTHSMTWNLASQFIGGTINYHSLTMTSYDPFNNKPLVLNYNLPQTLRVSIALSTVSSPPQGCDNNVCLAFEKYEESGNHTITWSGTDTTGVYNPSYKIAAIVSSQSAFQKNVVVVFGTKPNLTNLIVSPPTFGPSNGMQTVSFDMSTYQNQAAVVKIQFFNQGSLSILRTIDIPNQTPGHVTVNWDGRADNGMFVAPGNYTVIASVTDQIGNKASLQILTRIRY
jgi:flagellar hook assembly protein FlgD